MTPRPPAPRVAPQLVPPAAAELIAMFWIKMILNNVVRGLARSDQYWRTYYTLSSSMEPAAAVEPAAEATKYNRGVSTPPELSSSWSQLPAPWAQQWRWWEDNANYCCCRPGYCAKQAGPRRLRSSRTDGRIPNAGLRADFLTAVVVLEGGHGSTFFILYTKIRHQRHIHVPDPDDDLPKEHTELLEESGSRDCRWKPATAM